MDGIEVIVALMIVVGLAGILVPVLPGLVLVWAAVLLWAVVTQGAVAWVTLALATVVVALGSVVKYLLPGKRLRESGVPWRTMALGGVLGIIGFFVIPVVGVVVGFVLGVYLAELARLGHHDRAWPSTRSSLVAVGWSILIELATGLVTAAVWVAGVSAT